MNYKILNIENVDRGYGEQGIVLSNIFSVEKIEGDTPDDKLLCLREECDGYHKKNLTKEEFLLMLEELKHWIEQ